MKLLMAKFCARRDKLIPICTQRAKHACNIHVQPMRSKEEETKAKKTSKQCESFASNLSLPIFGFQSLASNVPRELATLD
jgi:hypothetical protein